MKTMFTIKGNICGDRIRLVRAMQKPPITQEKLAKKMQLNGMELTKAMISRIEKGERHVCDGELRMFANVLNVTMDWLVDDTDNPKGHKEI